MSLFNWGLSLKLLAALFAGCAAVACGNDESPTSSPESTESAENANNYGVVTLGLRSAIPKCGPAHRGVVYYVSSSSDFFYCDGRTLEALDLEGPEGSSCTVTALSGGALVSCSDGSFAVVMDGKDGKDGRNGKNGKNGRNGENGHNGKNGRNGKDGHNGKNGSSCTVVNDGAGTITITCEDGSVTSYPVPFCGNGIAEAGEQCDGSPDCGPDCTVQTQVCTQDVKECPDGSYVSRDPNLGCAFSPCPETCCDPEKEPGKFGNPICFEGAACCPNGEWSCSIGDGKTFACDGETTTGPFGEICPLSCTQDVKICEDGSAVGRDPKNACEFFPCPEACGGIAGNACAEGEICELPAGACSSADLFGKCQPQPAACLEIYEPVCGCDGVTYGNDCARRSAGVQKDSDGPCQVACTKDAKVCPDGSVVGRDPSNSCEFFPCPELCGGIAGLPCAADERCELPAGACSSADLFGKCDTIPELCTKEYKPVCGCDGMTYGNDCERRRAGVQKDTDGPCEVACTDDAQLCPDGSAVGRDPSNNCEFFPCPPPPEAECKSDADCQLVDFYCESCECLAQPVGAPPPQCDLENPVVCLVAPCSNVEAASCDAQTGQCVVVTAQ